MMVGKNQATLAVCAQTIVYFLLSKIVLIYGIKKLLIDKTNAPFLYQCVM